MDARVLLAGKPTELRLVQRGLGSDRDSRDNRQRKPASSDEHIDDIGVRFMARLAGKTSLAETARLRPDLVNRLAEFIDDRLGLIAAIDRIVKDDKPGRDGLPFNVIKELAGLREQCVLGQRKRLKPAPR